MAAIEFSKLPDAPFGTLVTGLKYEHKDDPAIAAQLRQLVMETSLIVCDDIDLNPQQLVDLGRMFGDLSPMSSGDDTRVLDGVPEIFVVSNIIDADGNPIGTYGEKDIWHADHAYRRIPSECSLFYPRRLPENMAYNQTSFCSMVNAHLLLPDELMAKLRTATLYHDAEWRDARDYPGSVYDPANRIKYPVLGHPIMRKIDHSDLICMFLSGTTGRYVIDSFGTRHESDFVDDLIARVTIPERVYTHHYRPRQLVAWSNHTAMHKPQPAMRRDQLVSENHPNARLMHRVAVKGVNPPAAAFE